MTGDIDALLALYGAVVVADAVSSLVADPSRLSEADASDALRVLAAVAAYAPVSPALGHMVAGAVSSVLESPSGANPAMLSSAGSAAFALADGLGRGVSCAGGSGGGASVSSGAMAMAVVCGDAAGPLTTPGSAASVDALPEGVAGGAGTMTQFMALTFDPKLNLSAADSSGVVSLQLRGAADGAEVPIAGLTTLITLTLPSARIGDGMVAAPAWWDAELQAYSSAGMVALPNPAPPAALLTLDWVPGFSATSDDVLPLAWTVSGVAADGCADNALDCGVAAQRALSAPACAGNASAPSWSCGGATAGVLRIWTGCACALWQDAACRWNVSTQSFQGGGCVTSDTTRVATRHLTTFTVQAEPPKIKTLSAKDLVSISPNDLVNVKELLIIVCVLFAGMHLGSWVLARLDARDFRRLAELAYSPQLGCTRIEDAAGGAGTLTTWRFTQDELVLNHKYVGHVSGTAVGFAGLIGVPFSRLACAIPDTLFGTQPTGHCIGRADGLCPSRLVRLRSMNSLERPHASEAAAAESPRQLRLVAGEADEAPGAPAASGGGAQQDASGGGGQQDADLVTVASTALMHAMLVSWCLASSDDIVVQQRMFINHFFRDPADVGRRAHDFLRMYVIFKEMLIGGTLRAAKNWLPKARMWRTILLANAEGFWEPNEALAFALLANNQAFPPTKLQGFQVVASLFSTVGAMLVGSCITGESAGSSEQASAGAELVNNARRMVRQRSNAKAAAEGAKQLTHKEMSAAAWDDVDGIDAAFAVEDGVHDAEREGNVDPLFFSADAIRETAPPALAAALGDDAALAGRVWATALVAAYLESNNLFTWRVSPRSTPLAEQQTLLDVAQAWITAQLECAPADLLPDVVHAARIQVRLWCKLHDRRVTSSRGAHIATREHVKLQARNAAAKVHSTLVNGHPVIALFASELSIGFARWMGFNVLVSAIMAMLVVNIWHVCRHACPAS